MKKLLILTIISSLLLTSCGEEKKEISKKYYKTVLVQTWSISDSDSFVGYTDSFNNVTLWAKVGWKIVSITKNVWDKVKIWEVVATLDAIEAKTWYSSSLDIISSLEALKISTSQMYDSQIEVLNGKINSAKTWIEMANIWVSWSEAWTQDTKNISQNQLKTIDSQISQAQIWLESIKLQLENTKDNLNQKEEDIYSNSKNAISNANILANNLVDFLDNIYWVTDKNKYTNDSFEMYISAKNTAIKTQAENALKNFINSYSTLKDLPLDSKENIKIALEKYNNVFSNDIRNMLKLAYSTMENSISSTNFPESSISSYKSQINSFQNGNEQVILTVSGNYFLGLKWSLDSINNFTKEKKSTLDNLEKQVQLAEKQIDTLNQTKEQISSQSSWAITDITTKTEIAKKTRDLSQNALQEAKSSLEALKKQKQASLSEIDTQISQVKSGKNDAKVMIENGKVISLIDWIVTKKLSEVWNVVWAGTPILIVSSDDKIKIEVQVNDEIINKINLLNEVKVEIEWVSEQLTWIITKILPTRDLITKKSSVEITIDNQNENIKIWSYSKIYFNIENNTENWIIIPNSAIVSKYNLPQVFVLENWVAKLKNIKTLKQNDNFSQIEWLWVWEIIITDGKENVFDGESL